jgi:hypothetical protein
MKPIAWYDPSNGVVSTDQDCPLFTPLGQVWPLCLKREWVGLMRGVRVEGDTVIISVKGGNDAARELCGALIEEKNNG